jgi:hypothetical protein
LFVGSSSGSAVGLPKGLRQTSALLRTLQFAHFARGDASRQAVESGTAASASAV